MATWLAACIDIVTVILTISLSLTLKPNMTLNRNPKLNYYSVILQQPRMSHVRPLLKSLHLLPVSQRIEFKVAVMTYKILSTSRPVLLSNRISGSSATLRSASRPLLHVPRTQTVYSSRAFRVTVPLWNSLPADIINSTSLTVF